MLLRSRDTYNGLLQAIIIQFPIPFKIPGDHIKKPLSFYSGSFLEEEVLKTDIRKYLRQERVSYCIFSKFPSPRGILAVFPSFICFFLSCPSWMDTATSIFLYETSPSSTDRDNSFTFYFSQDKMGIF